MSHVPETYLDEKEFEGYPVRSVNLVLEVEDLDEVAVFSSQLLFWHPLRI